tara:strand:+ start:14783 stop:16180 length:1398 start_codon:yes stop_codon:yes gene_type:complete
MNTPILSKRYPQDLISLVSKYNVPGPRYTSYPTALQFTDTFDQDTLYEYLNNRRQTRKSLSLYIHIPFCHSLCWYCGCTKVITKDPASADKYIDYLEKEIHLTMPTIHPDSVIKQIHFGGGTPTFLLPEQIFRIGEIINRSYNLHPDNEFSVEIDPRRVHEEHINALKEIGCTRASLGVQDTNEEVQKAIHRIQPFGQTKHITDLLRNAGIKNINFDLIYGLPKQSLTTFRDTLTNVLSMNPDRLAIYSYAHMPDLMPSQKLLNEDDFPSTTDKLSMLIYAVETLPNLGYTFIGMDHFAKSDDELSLALQNETLQRNFQGYSTHADLEMIGLGMSAISQNSEIYRQNEKALPAYYSALDSEKLPIQKILKLTDEDQIRKKIIMQIMCKAELNFDKYPEKFGFNFQQIFKSELERISEFESDGLIIKLKNGFRISNTGRLFLRNIAMVFDTYLSQHQKKRSYSKTV